MQIFFIILFLSSLLQSQAILHSPVEDAVEQTPVLIEAFIDLPDYEIKKVTLFFRKKGEVKYLESPMFKIDAEYLGEIPAGFVEIGGIEYFLVVDTYDMGFVGLPNISPTNNPFRIEINKKKKINQVNLLSEFNPDYTILNPEPNTKNILDDVFISISYFQMDNINSSKSKFFFNDIDISNAVNFNKNYLIFYPEKVLLGINTVKIVLVDDFGIEYNPITWNFIAQKEEQVSFLNFKQSGKVKTDYSNSLVDTTTFNEKTLDFIYNAKFDWLDLRANAHLSSLENSLEQPKNRFYVDLRSEFFRLKLGDVYPNFGEYFIKRNRIRGIDFNFNSKKYTFNFILGEINRATQGNAFSESTIITDVFLDSTYNDDGTFLSLDSPRFSINRDNYTFSRKITALQFKFPIKENMNLKFSILKAKDNIPSVYTNVPDAIVELPKSLNPYILDGSLLSSSDSLFQTISDTVFLDNGQIDSINQIPDTTITNYISAQLLKNNYLDLFKKSLTGLNCYDSNGNLAEQFNNKIDCQGNGFLWIQSGLCYENDGQSEENINETIFEESSCISENGLIRRWVPFLKINVLEKQWTGVSPKDNFVIGTEFESFFDRDRLRFNSGLSLSLLNENTWDPVLTYASLDTLGGDPEDGSLAGYEIPENLDLSKYESIFQSGINQVPLIPIDITGQSGLLKVLSMPSLAYHFSLEGDYYGHKVSYKFKQIGPEYNSLGNVYLQQDIREQSISDKLGLLDNKLYLNVKYKLLEEGVSYDNQEKGKTNKFDIIINFSPGAGLSRLSSAIGYQNRTNGVRSNDFIEYQIDDSQKIDIDSRKEDTEIIQFNFALTTPIVYYGDHNLTLSIYNSNTDDLVSDENILYSFESDSTFDAFPYISPKSSTRTTNINLQSTLSPFISTSLNFSRTFFDYGIGIPYYYSILNQNESTFNLDSDYDYSTALANIQRFDDIYGDILYQKQILNSYETKVVFNSYFIFDIIKLGANFTNASGVVKFDQFGLSMSLVKYLFDDFFLTFDYDRKLKKIAGGDTYNNSYSFLRLGYEF